MASLLKIDDSFRKIIITEDLEELMEEEEDLEEEEALLVVGNVNLLNGVRYYETNN